jgi:hypothetical protein
LRYCTIGRTSSRSWFSIEQPIGGVVARTCTARPLAWRASGWGERLAALVSYASMLTNKSFLSLLLRNSGLRSSDLKIRAADDPCDRHVPQLVPVIAASGKGLPPPR